MTTRPFAIRPGREGDVPFISNSWLKCARTIPPWPTLSSAQFFDPVHGYKARVASLLEKATVLVAVSNDDDDDIFGYVVAEPEPRILHFVYVKGGPPGVTLRGMAARVGVGVGSELVREALPEFGRAPTVVTERFRYVDQWKAWCLKYRLVYHAPTSRFFASNQKESA